MLRRLGLCCVLCFALVLVGCGAKEQTVGKSTDVPEKEQVVAESAGATEIQEPDRVNVQHILIGFEGSVSGKDITRTEEEAQQLAQELYERAKAGEDFGALVEEYTDDSYPGIYGIVNFGQPAEPEMQIYARDSMVPAFGDVAFSLGVEEIGLAPYDKKKSKYGWHIIKRLR